MKKVVLSMLLILSIVSCSKKDTNPLGQKIRSISNTKWVEHDKTIPYGIGHSSYVHLWFENNDQDVVAFEDEQTGQYSGYFDMTYSLSKTSGDIEIKFKDDHNNVYDWTGTYIYGILFVDGVGYKKE